MAGKFELYKDVDGAPNAFASNWVKTAPFGADQQQYLYAISNLLVVPGAGLSVGIDIKPGSDPQCGGVNPVAVLGSDTLDVSQIDPATLGFEGLGVRIRGNDALTCTAKDTNSDGHADLVCQFANGSTEGVVTGRLMDGTRIEGTDDFCVAH